MADILIVGAGPVGLTMAAEFVRYGLAVRIIDRAEHPTQTSKALVIWSRTLELLDRAGASLAFLDAGLRAHGGAIRSGGTLLGRARFDHIASPYNFALMIPQSETERLLTAHLSSLGVTIERQLELVSFSQQADHVEARLRHIDGREEVLSTPWLIGCDGAHSAVRHGLRVEFHGSAQGDDWMLADIRLDGEGAPATDEVASFLHRKGPLVVFPIPGGRARIVAVIGKTDPQNPRPDPTLADVQAMVDERCGAGVRVTDPVWLTTFRINERKASNYSQGRVFLAGDAAHIHSPAGGQGMNTGMQDAFNLAWKLAMVVHGQASPSLLDSYSPERSAVGKLVLQNASRMTDMATLSPPAAQAVRNMALRFLLGLHAVQDKLSSTMSETDIAYADSPLSDGPGAGNRLAPEDYDGPPPGSGNRPRLVLMTADTDKGAALATRFPDLLEPSPRRPPNASRLLIIRPDGYIGLSARRNEWNKGEAYLKAFA
ncbi:FAD-binding monooxygenase [Labrys miyagiensis]|uniref:FAD-binding monooxygenase n=1 Tax=Labrys miyagiensis TaxID=346912 RepID=A0ABQ6CSZ9_9HYPH|nr:FAD-dependent monooxygenase [Labrys miyagiensis]GLS22890.1 FAD-binding monooxygenase [Labrys miyagiensis]